MCHSQRGRVTKPHTTPFSPPPAFEIEVANAETRAAISDGVVAELLADLNAGWSAIPDSRLAAGRRVLPFSVETAPLILPYFRGIM